MARMHLYLFGVPRNKRFVCVWSIILSYAFDLLISPLRKSAGAIRRLVVLVSTRLCEVARLGTRLYLGRRPRCFSQFDFEDHSARNRLILLYWLHDLVLKDITTRTNKTFRLRTICTAKRLSQRQFITLTLDGLDCSISHIL